MGMTFSKATKKSAKLRLAIFGPSGAGKTFTALRLATGLGGAIALVDTERGSASKYADRFAFDVLELPQKDIETYIEAIGAAKDYNVLIVDSLSHGWQELLEEIDRLAKSKYKGNTWSAWSDGTPKQRKLVDAILNFPGHIIATMRSKTEWTLEEGNNGKSKPVRVGLAPEQGKGIEYEFDLLMELSPDHVANVIKDRTGKYQDKTLDKPGEAFGKELADWLNSGTAETVNPPAPAKVETPAPVKVETPLAPPANGWHSALEVTTKNGNKLSTLTIDQLKLLVEKSTKPELKAAAELLLTPVSDWSEWFAVAEQAEEAHIELTEPASGITHIEYYRAIEAAKAKLQPVEA